MPEGQGTTVYNSVLLLDPQRYTARGDIIITYPSWTVVSSGCSYRSGPGKVLLVPRTPLTDYIPDN